MKKIITSLILLFIVIILISYGGGRSSSPIENNSLNAFANRTGDFFLRIPAGYKVDESYTTRTDRGTKISGVKFTIPSAMATGTNLSLDTFISVESLPQQVPCRADLFMDSVYRPHISELTQNGIKYTLATTSDAAAGNRYDISVFAFNGRNSCMAVRYFIHYGVIQNYDSGAVKEFNERAVLAQFETIRSTLRVNE